MKYKTNESELSKLEKQIHAYDYHKNTTQKQAKRSEIDRLRL